MMWARERQQTRLVAPNLIYLILVYRSEVLKSWSFRGRYTYIPISANQRIHYLHISTPCHRVALNLCNQGEVSLAILGLPIQIITWKWGIIESLFHTIGVAKHIWEMNIIYIHVCRPHENIKWWRQAWGFAAEEVAMSAAASMYNASGLGNSPPSHWGWRKT